MTPNLNRRIELRDPQPPRHPDYLTVAAWCFFLGTIAATTYILINR
ncbi:MAG: hypothetical protein WCL08_00375 [Verrucomicrobiota bacterium]